MAIPKVSEIQIDLSAHDARLKIYLNKVVEAMRPWVDDINQAIDAYNNLEDENDRASYLAAIEAKVTAMDNAQTEVSLVYCPEYFEKIQGTLFREIQAEHRQINLDANTKASAAPLSLTELIAEMDPDKVSQLTSILSTQTGDALKVVLGDLYQAGDADKPAFDAFLKAHVITRLGVGETDEDGNAKNFKVTNKNTGETQVLKVENRLGYSKEAEMQLRESDIAGVLTAVFVNRRTSYIDKKTGANVSRSLQVTEYCPGSDIEAYGLSLDDDNFRLISATSFHIRMAEILEAMKAAGCAFPDMKNINWLIDSETRLRFSDGKSIKLIDADGNLDPRLGIIRSEEMTAPEMIAKPPMPFSADKMHAHILGKNLYQYLTGCNVLSPVNGFYKLNAAKNAYVVISDAEDLDFSHPVFSTPKGRLYEALLRDTIKTNPDDRLSLAEIQARIKMIDPEYATADIRQAEILKDLCSKQLQVLATLKMGASDNYLQTFLDKQRERLTEESSVYQLLQIGKKIEETGNAIAVISDKIREEISRLEQKEMHKEVALLEELVRDFSLEERANLLQLDKNENERLVEVLETIDKLEREKTPDDEGVSALLTLIHQQKEAKEEQEESKRYMAAKQTYKRLRTEILKFKGSGPDPQMKDFSLEVSAALTADKRRNNIEIINQSLQDVLDGLKVYMQQIELEIKTLEDSDMAGLVGSIKEAIARVPVTARNGVDAAKNLVIECKQAAEKAAAEEVVQVKVEEENCKQAIKQLLALQVTKIEGSELEDHEMEDCIEEFSNDLGPNPNSDDFKRVTRLILGIVSDIEVLSKKINQKIGTLIASDDNKNREMAEALSRAMAGVPVDCRKRAFEYDDVRSIWQNIKVSEGIQKTQDFKQALSDEDDSSEYDSESDDDIPPPPPT